MLTGGACLTTSFMASTACDGGSLDVFSLNYQTMPPSALSFSRIRSRAARSTFLPSARSEPSDRAAIFRDRGWDANTDDALASSVIRRRRRCIWCVPWYPERLDGCYAFWCGLTFELSQPRRRTRLAERRRISQGAGRPSATAVVGRRLERGVRPHRRTLARVIGGCLRPPGLLAPESGLPETPGPARDRRAQRPQFLEDRMVRAEWG